jgi:hypothetical protein
MAARLANLPLRCHHDDRRSVTRLEERQQLLDEAHVVVVDIEGDYDLAPCAIRPWRNAAP